ncbi:MAG: phospholipid-binding protein [Oscillatoria sp. PMC 1051.18]|uniref:phospholipid-binding protein n=1 Tax=Oscillatoria salina TaxID=331517 RepID=UPI0013B6B5C4|nr:phospholipid-binding protein [Oscillatoria salina]MBZ8181308.1 phospholipid-binding protein [Oscillatoria salina IIICB1]MEC4892046.1 phospholipid-binding protein [Oscillatoria sp. PMC 1050.18]MEC5028986.1 phospholipid-binding protein [Oscillatoria sp. PMC 1051.18]NET90732.1 phospholipid-binding protein [Kamptonema sp. SIO1D9]
MGWLKRIFNLVKPGSKEAEEAGSGATVVQNASVSPTPEKDDIPPERVGLSGEYDQSGLAKRVVLAFDEDPDLDDEERLWVAQTGTTVVLKGEVSDQATLDKMVSTAKGVNGCQAVDTSQVQVG